MMDRISDSDAQLNSARASSPRSNAAIEAPDIT